MKVFYINILDPIKWINENVKNLDKNDIECLLINKSTDDIWHFDILDSDSLKKYYIEYGYDLIKPFYYLAPYNYIYKTNDNYDMNNWYMFDCNGKFIY